MHPTELEEQRSPTSEMLRQQKRSEWRLYLVLIAAVMGLTPLMVLGASSVGFSALLGGMLVLVTLALTIWRPIFGFYLIAVCAVVIEQQPIATPIVTDGLDIFHWPQSLSGLPERPLGFFFVFVLLVLIFGRVVTRQRVLAGGKLMLPLLVLLAAVAMGVLHGLVTGGNAKSIVLEVRPFWWLFLCYVLAYNVVCSKRHIVVFMWILILGDAFKALQGLYIIITALHGHLSGQNQIMAHEQSFFWICLILLLVLFLLQHRPRAQFYSALVALPFVVLALVANNRRADYLGLVVGILVAWILVIVVKPRARTKLTISLAACLLIGGAYVLAFSHAGGSLAKPAQAVISAIHPSASDQRDTLSNQYRMTEDFDLLYTERQSPLLGYGFGKPFLQPVPLPDIAGLDPIYLLVPHNTIYWVWMRLGPLGYFALWYLIGAVIVHGCLIVRQLRDNYLRMFGIFVIATTFIEVMLAYADYQLFFYRNVIFFGLTVGMMLKLPAIDTALASETVAARVVRSLNGGRLVAP